MENESIGNIMLRESARALPWGIMLLVVIAISGMWLRQEVKETIQYTVNTGIQQGKQALLDPSVFVPIKQNVKDAIQFTADTAAREAKRTLLATPTFMRIKQNTKEAIQYATRNAADQYVRAQRELRQKP